MVPYVKTALMLLACVGLAAAMTVVGPRSRMTLAVEATRTTYLRHLGAWETATVAFEAVPLDSAGLLRAAHASVREAYKRVEWLVAYYDEEAVVRYVNGAPLPKVEPKVAEVRVIAPSGLQSLEELVYAPDARGDSEAVAGLRAALTAETARLARDLRRRPLAASDVFAAARYGLVRVFALGVTGFDTPASGRAIREAAVALGAIRAGVGPLVAAQRELPRAVRDSIAVGFARGLERLHAAATRPEGFREFDRLAFLRESIDPLYSSLLSAHIASGADMPGEGAVIPQGHHYRSRSLFADDFLRDYVYAGQPETDSLFSRKRELGERLFSDASLSASGTLSCASCHDPARAFTDGRARSLGNDGQPLLRNAPTLIGAVYAERYFADLREPTLARQIRHVVQDAHEFGTDYLTVLDSLRGDPQYAAAFDAAYAELPEEYRISTHSLSDALVSYIRTLHSNSSLLDRYVRGEAATVPADVRRGFILFMGEAACGTCHFAPTFAGLVPPFYRESESEVLGVPAEWPMTDSTGLDADPGRAGSGRPQDGAPFYFASFKTPTVRNAALTAPYMHNGAFESLAEVIDFYHAGGGAGWGSRSRTRRYRSTASC